MKKSAHAAASVVFEGVSKRFGAVNAVDGISLTVPAGRLVTLLGPSGCGKTTMLRMIAGLELPDAGDLRIGGTSVARQTASERDVSMVFQSYALFPHMTVLENVAYGPRMSGKRRTEAAAAARETMRMVGLEGFDARFPHELSGGQQQRVAVARALVLEPQVLLFDEPLSNLDARLRRQVRADIRALQQRLGITVVYVTHDQEEALAVSDEIVVMEAGRIAQHGTPEDLYRRPASRFIATFIGEANIVEGEVVPSDTGPQLRLDGQTFDCLSGQTDPGCVQLALRPEALTLADAPPSDGGLHGRITAAAFLGARWEYLVSTSLGDLLVFDTGAQGARAPGHEVWLTPQPHGVAVLPANR